MKSDQREVELLPGGILTVPKKFDKTDFFSYPLFSYSRREDANSLLNL